MTSSVLLLRAAEKRTPGSSDFEVVVLSLLHHLLLCGHYEEARVVFEQLQSLQQCEEDHFNEARCHVTVFQSNTHNMFHGELAKAIKLHGPWYVDVVHYYNYVTDLYCVRTSYLDVTDAFPHTPRDFVRLALKFLQEIHLHILTKEFFDYNCCMAAYHKVVFQTHNDTLHVKRSNSIIQLIRQLMTLAIDYDDEYELTYAILEVITDICSKIDDAEFTKFLLLTPMKLFTLKSFVFETANNSKWNSVRELICQLNL